MNIDGKGTSGAGGSAAKPPKRAARSFEQIREHYLLERELADRLRNSTKEERGRLYASVYEELFRRVPHHPMLARRADAESRRAETRRHVRLLAGWFNSQSVFMEIGPGDCSLALAMAERVKKVYAIDVSSELADKAAGVHETENLDLVVSDGCNIDVPQSTVDLAYSNQVLEHLHPEDAADHLRNVARALVAGGAYFCSTPNRIGGPHDVSKYFDRQAAGFHLKEYTRRELIRQFREAGFSRVMLYLDLRGRRVRFPAWVIVALERCLGVLPFKAARGMARCLPLRIFVNAWVVAVK